jgi:maleate cis-trans isomerase
MPESTRVDGWRLKLGRVAPTTVEYPNDVSRLLPEGAKVIATSAGARSFGEQSMSDARARRRDAIREIDDWGVDCIIAAGGPVATLGGADGESRFVEEIRETVSVPFTTSLGAQIDALRSLDATDLLVVTPFPPERDAETRAYLEAHGFEVVAMGGPEFEQPGQTRDLHPSASYQYATALAEQTDEAFDAVYVACRPFGSVEHVERLEADVGRPAVTSSQAQVWWAFEATGIDPELTGYGRLFEADRPA